MTSDRETVAVVLPYRNREDTLGEALASVLTQTHTRLEVLLVDDASTDRSADVARAAQDPRVRHLRSPVNVGVSAARNVGLAATDRELVAFMDSDDVWLPEKLERQVTALRQAQATRPDVAVVGCGWRLYGASTPQKRFLPGPFTMRDVLCEDVAGIGTPMLLVDRSVARTGALFDPDMPALTDRDYVATCLSNDTRLLVVPEVLALVRRGRHDHVANAARAGRAYERLLDKYAAELAPRQGAASRYAYRAAREHVLSGHPHEVLRLWGRATQQQRGRRTAHLLLGAVGRQRGFAAAERLLPLTRSRRQT